MIKTEYRRDMGKNYMIFREETQLEEGYFLKLLLNSKIEGLLPLEVRMIDGCRECCYDVTGKQSLKGVFERGGLEREQLEEILGRLKKIIKDGEEYLLQPEDYVLEPEAMFLDLSDFSLYLCYFPGYKKPMEEKWRRFTEYLMNIADDRNEDTVLYVYSLYKGAREDGGFAEKIPGERRDTDWRDAERRDTERKVIERGDMDRRDTDRRDTGRREADRRVRAAVPDFEERIEEETQVEVYPKKIYVLAAGLILSGVIAALAGLFFRRPAPMQAGAYLLIIGAVIVYGLYRLFSPERKETRIDREVEFIPAEEVYEKEDSDAVFQWERQEDESTVVLAAADLEENCFLRAEDSRKYQDIELVEFPFFIGKLKTQVNSRIESPAVSRFHAKIEHLGGEHYLVDLNSTNGTYLNGERLRAQERRKLTAGDKVRFADAGYYFDAKE